MAKTPDWSTKKIELIQEASRHAEAKMVAQVQFAVSADARASILAGIYVAAATGCVAALAASTTLQGRPAAIGAAIGAVAAFISGAYLCVWATLPCDFHLPGNEPANWYGEIEKDAPIAKAAGEQLALFDSDIRENNCTLATNAKKFQWGALIGISAPFAGLAGALIGGFLFRVLGVFPDLDKYSISLRDVIAAVIGSLIVLAAIWYYQRSALP